MSSVIISGDTSGSITIAAPNVAGTNTLTLPANTGTVITTASTFAGTGPAFNAYAGSAQSIANTTHTKIQLNTEVFDTNNNFDNTTNYRFTPTVAGYYQITGSVQLASTSAISAVEIYKNGGIAAQGRGVGTGGLNQAGNVSAILYANGSTDYFELYVYQPSGGAINTTAASDLTYMCGALIRSA